MTCFAVSLYDQEGDGWEDDELTISDSDSGVALSILTQTEPFPDAFVGEEYEVCFPCGDYEAAAGGGAYTDRVYWVRSARATRASADEERAQKKRSERKRNERAQKMKSERKRRRASAKDKERAHKKTSSPRLADSLASAG
jgi:hypothetical protein